MKHLALFLFATLAHADIYIQRINSEQTDQGYMFRFVENGVQYCWAMPQMLDQSFIPPTWTPVTQAAIDYRWPVMTGDAEAACLDGPKIYRTVGSPLWGLTIGLQTQVIGSVPAGIPCGEQMAQWYFLRTVTYSGQKGFAVCF